jgi:cytochrome c oxidase accessory protein FixG
VNTHRNFEAEDDAADLPPLFVARRRVYPQRVSGPIRRLKWAALAVLLAVYYVTPWLRWDRGPAAPGQAVLIDMAGPRGYFFFLEIWPQEIYYLAGLLILAALGLFLVTTLAGRLWCGFACPQTVWTDLFMAIERFIEGDRTARMRRDAAAPSFGRTWRKAVKHVLWLLIAALTGGAWILYFNDAPRFVADLVNLKTDPVVLGFVGLFTATTYVLAGWAREQVCVYMCPWPRIQSAMFDEHTQLVAYDERRGEPRGNARAATHRGSDPLAAFIGRGHCIDCGLCTRVCPTGIDIRDGNQLACIGCGLCIDACDGIMTKLGLPPKLIGFAASVERTSLSARLSRPRVLIYVAAMLVVAGVMLMSLLTRADVEVSILADRAPLFVRLSDGRIQDGYTVKVANKLHQTRKFDLSIGGLPQAQVAVVGELPLTVAADSTGSFRVYVNVPRPALSGERSTYRFAFTDRATGKVVTHDAIFLGPGR